MSLVWPHITGQPLKDTEQGRFTAYKETSGGHPAQHRSQILKRTGDKRTPKSQGKLSLGTWKVNNLLKKKKKFEIGFHGTSTKKSSVEHVTHMDSFPPVVTSKHGCDAHLPCCSSAVHLHRPSFVCGTHTVTGHTGEPSTQRPFPQWLE